MGLDFNVSDGISLLHTHVFCENYCKGLEYIEPQIAVNMITFGKIGNVKNASLQFQYLH